MLFILILLLLYLGRLDSFIFPTFSYLPSPPKASGEGSFISKKYTSPVQNPPHLHPTGDTLHPLSAFCRSQKSRFWSSDL